MVRGWADVRRVCDTVVTARECVLWSEFSTSTRTSTSYVNLQFRILQAGNSDSIERPAIINTQNYFLRVFGGKKNVPSSKNLE